MQRATTTKLSDSTLTSSAVVVQGDVNLAAAYSSETGLHGGRAEAPSPDARDIVCSRLRGEWRALVVSWGVSTLVETSLSSELKMSRLRTWWPTFADAQDSTTVRVGHDNEEELARIKCEGKRDQQDGLSRGL